MRAFLGPLPTRSHLSKKNMVNWIPTNSPTQTMMKRNLEANIPTPHRRYIHVKHLLLSDLDLVLHHLHMVADQVCIPFPIHLKLNDGAMLHLVDHLVIKETRLRLNHIRHLDGHLKTTTRLFLRLLEVLLYLHIDFLLDLLLPHRYLRIKIQQKVSYSEMDHMSSLTMPMSPLQTLVGAANNLAFLPIVIKTLLVCSRKERRVSPPTTLSPVTRYLAHYNSSLH